MTEYQLLPSASLAHAVVAATETHRANLRARKCSVLLIEDQIAAVAAVFAALDPATHDIELASCDSAAAALVEDRAIDVILLSLSNADGIRTMIELKRGTDTPVVALVGGTDYFQLNYQLRMATATGANGTVVKPIAPERLRVAIDLALGAVARVS